MKLLVLLFVVLLSAQAFSQDQPHHIISVGADGFGWDGIGSNLDWDKNKSGIDENTSSESKLKVNYNYVFENRVMLGGEISSESSESEMKLASGTKNTDEITDARFGVSLGYNFNEDLNRSWWIKGTLGTGAFKSENKTAGVKSKLEYDFGYFTISGGKRISLESWGLTNVSYNPSIALTSYSVSGDAEDAGLDGYTEAKLEIIKIDILF